MLRNILLLTIAVSAMTAHAENKPTPREGCRGNCPTGQPVEIDNNATAIAGSKSKAIGIGEGGDAASSSKSKSKSKSASESSSGGNIIETNVAGDDGDTVTNVNNSDYVIPAHADAGIAFAMLQGCYGIGGVDARGSGPTTAGGLTLNIFKLTNDRCVLAAKALEAQANGNLNGYATMTCADKATWRGYRTVMSAVEDRKVSKNEAIISCITETKSVALLMSQRLAKSETKTRRLEGLLNEMTGGK